MHNIDRILNEESNHEYGFLQGEQGHEFGGSQEFGFAQEGEWENEWEFNQEYGNELSQEQMEYELATELLAVTNEAELEQFLGKLVSRVGRGISNFAKSNVGRSLISGLKSVAKTALPIVGKVAGTALGGPIGGMLGGKLAGMATNLFEVQLEGMSNEDREFEIAKRVVRYSTAATQRASAMTARNPAVPAKAVALSAMKQAAVKHAPGLLTPSGTTGGGFSGGGGISSGNTASFPASGTWVRNGNNIIINL